MDDVKRDYKLVHEEQEDYGSLIYNQTDGYEQAKAFQYLVHERSNLRCQVTLYIQNSTL